MNKTELVSAVAESSGAKKADVEAVIERLINIIQDEVAKGEKVQFLGFGTFERRERAERTMRNPQTGEPLAVPASKYPAFSAGKAFKEKVNPKPAESTQSKAKESAGKETKNPKTKGKK